jgi:hypothetical protein
MRWISNTFGEYTNILFGIAEIAVEKKNLLKLA